MNKKTLESLIKAGALAEFGKRSALLTVYPQIAEVVHNHKLRTDNGQTSLFAEEENIEIGDHLPEMEELSKQELLAFERELLGFYLTEHPLSPHIDKLEKRVTHKISALTASMVNPVIIGGIVTKVKKIITKKSNAEMAFVKLDDLSSTIELIVFPSTYEKTKNVWKNDQVVLLKGKVSEKDDRISVIVDDAKILTY